MKTCELCDVAYIPEVGHMCDRGLEKLQVKDAKIAELEAQLASEENWHDTFEKLYLEADKDNERLRGALQDVIDYGDGKHDAEIALAALEWRGDGHT